MQILTNGIDITERCEIKEAVMDDRMGAGCDSLSLCLENQQEWLAWQEARPGDGQPGERAITVEIQENGYTSGLLYVDELEARKEGYRIRARSVPVLAEETTWESYRNVRLWELLRIAAQRMNMAYAVYGTDAGQFYPHLQREGVGWMAFLHWLATAEGMRLKASGGKLLLIDGPWLTAQPCARYYQLKAGMNNWRLEESGTKAERLTILSPVGEGTAMDSAVATGVKETLCGLPIFSAMQANRWARGLLAGRNEACETLTLWTALDVGLAAGSRVGLSGVKTAEGEWLIHRAQHDFIGRATTLQLRREIGTVC